MSSITPPPPPHPTQGDSSLNKHVMTNSLKTGKKGEKWGRGGKSRMLSYLQPGRRSNHHQAKDKGQDKSRFLSVESQCTASAKNDKNTKENKRAL